MAISATRHAFELWSAPGGADRRLRPDQELIAEHHVIHTVLQAMEKESEAMLAGQQLRTEFWANVVDFNGNFVHMCHRVKEEEHLVPALVEHGVLDAAQEAAIRQEHASGKDLTLSLCAGIEEGDWEKVLRVTSIYLHILRPHMQREEASLFALVATLPAASVQRLQCSFEQVDQRALGSRGRGHYASIARRLAKLTGVKHDLYGPASPH
jgi:hemerythrin-like domain-containing protein